MPTYEYACTSCGDHLEVVQSFRDDPLTECSGCGGALRKVFGSIGVVFKGSGFYKTDSRSSTKPSKAAEPSETKSADSSSEAKASEASGSSTATPAKEKASEPSKPSTTSSKAAS